MSVVVYGREGCHLCTEATDVIRGLGVAFSEVDIETDERLLRRYLELIPVIEVDGRVVATVAYKPALIREALAAEGYADGNE